MRVNDPVVVWAEGQIGLSYIYKNDDSLLSKKENLMLSHAEMPFLAFSGRTPGSSTCFSPSLTTPERQSKSISEASFKLEPGTLHETWLVPYHLGC